MQGQLREKEYLFAGNVPTVVYPDRVNVRWKVHSFVWVLIADVTVANRYQRIEPFSFNLGAARPIGFSFNSPVVTAGQTRNMVYDPRFANTPVTGPGSIAAYGVNTLIGGAPDDFWLNNSRYLLLTTDGGVAGDSNKLWIAFEEFQE